MNRIDLTNLGGFPLEQDTLKFMQDSYTAALSALANLCGNKTILFGVQVVSGNVTDGWISYNGELIPFVGGLLGTDVLIVETPTSAVFEDGNEHDIYFTKIASCGVGGDFPFSDLVPLLSLQNIWRPGDIKETMRDNAYIAANFDSSGYGLNAEIGWQILSKAYVNAAGKTMVNIDPADSNLDTAGKFGGEQAHTLTANEFSHSVVIPRGDAYTGNSEQSAMRVGGGQGSSVQTPVVVKIGNSSGIVDGHNNMQPYFVVLKLIKL